MMGVGEYFVIILLVLALSIPVRVWFMRRKNGAWQEVAANLGLHCIDGTLFQQPRLVGKLDGISLQASVVVDKGGETRTEFITVAAKIGARLPPGMQIYHEGVFQKLGKVFGHDDIQVDDEALDANFIFKGSQPAEVRQLVRSPGVKRALLVCHQHCASLRVENGEVLLKEIGNTRKTTKITTYIRFCIDVALALDAACSPPAQIAPTSQTAPAASATAQPETASAGPNDWW